MACCHDPRCPTSEPPYERMIADSFKELDRILAEDTARGTQFHPDYFRAYPNGCPILSEEHDGR